jgi:hypothetical protein
MSLWSLMICLGVSEDMELGGFGGRNYVLGRAAKLIPFIFSQTCLHCRIPGFLHQSSHYLRPRI